MNELHHGYLGIALIIVGYIMPRNKWRVWVISIGAYITADDIVLHAFDIRTPMKMLFGYAYQMEWVREVTRFIDGLFGRKY